MLYNINMGSVSCGKCKKNITDFEKNYRILYCNDCYEHNERYIRVLEKKVDEQAQMIVNLKQKLEKFGGK